MGRDFLDEVIASNPMLVEQYGLDTLYKFPTLINKVTKEQTYNVEYMFPNSNSRISMAERWVSIEEYLRTEFSKFHYRVDLEKSKKFREYASQLVNRKCKFWSTENKEFIRLYNLFCSMVISLHYSNDHYLEMSESEQLEFAQLLLKVVNISAYTADNVEQSLVLNHTFDMFGYSNVAELADDISKGSLEDIDEIVLLFKAVIRHSGYHY